MNYLYLISFTVFNKPANEVVLSDNKMTRELVEQWVKQKTFDSAIEFEITEYEISCKNEMKL